ncbi:MAG TPA: hypothetical protein VJL33_03065, partial [Candidatus Bathyarchaeia archaeon]|nr:hypothetical protein [Candidatus Bathyarchaeia archaeon]
AIVAWAPIETPLITYWQGTGQAEGGLDPTLLATISAVIIGVTLVLVTLSGYYIGKTKGKI